jgi:hypothetical protein
MRNEDTLCSVKEVHIGPNSCKVSNTVSRTPASSDLVLLSTWGTSFCSIHGVSYWGSERARENIDLQRLLDLVASWSPPCCLVPLCVSNVANVGGDENHSTPPSNLPSYLSTTDPNLPFRPTSLTMTLRASLPTHNPQTPHNVQLFQVSGASNAAWGYREKSCT